MQNYEGVVGFISEKAWFDRKLGQDINLYSFKLDGHDTWFRTGDTKPEFMKGQQIRFSSNGNNVDLSTVEITEATPVQTAPRPAGQSRVVTKDTYWADKEARDLEKEEYWRLVKDPMIQYQAARRDAVTLIVAALANEAVSFGTTAKGQRLAFLQDMVEETTQDLMVKNAAFQAAREEEK